MLLSCNEIHKAFGEYDILAGCSFNLDDREKAAIVGANGAGKSTLLKIISGEMKQDSGDVTIASGKTIGYLAQHQDISENLSIYEEVAKARAHVFEMEERLRKLELDMKEETGEGLERMMEAYNRLTHRFELINGFACRSEINGVIKGLGFTEEEFSRGIGTLSGGEKTRVALAKMLLQGPDILLLDEPTNHLDMNAIMWLENYLSNYKGSVLIVTHDRYFLDKVVTRIIEVQQGKASSYNGNYSEYMAKREKQLEDEIKQYENRQKEIKHQEEVIEKLRSFNREKSIKRAESREKLLNKMEVLDKPITENKKIKIKIEPNILSGNDVLLMKNLGKSFDGNVLFQDFSGEIFRGEKVAIIGNNGTGKTTLLKIINNVIQDYQGEFIKGAKVNVGYYDQEHNVLDMEKTMFEEIRNAFPELNNTKIRNTLAAFLFEGDKVFKKIKELSGGERGRVSLAKLMLSEANFLIMDEPTNHLDIESKEILEDTLNSYSGTVLYVSHDRYFINRTATRILELDNRQFNSFAGDYDYYLSEKEKQTIVQVEAETVQEKTESKQDWELKKEEQAKQRKRESDLKKTEEKIFELEEKIKDLDQQMEDPKICADVTALVKISNEKAELSTELETIYEIWETLAN